jgi:hypothetical protein
MIVIAQNCIDPVTRSQAADQFSTWSSITAVMRDVVAGQGDQIRTKIVGRFDRALQMRCVCERAVMKIRKMYDAQTVKGLWQASQKYLLPLDGQHERLGQSYSRHFAERGLY